MEMVKAKDVKAGMWVMWCGKPRNVLSSTRVNISGLALSMTVHNMPITIDLPDVNTVVIQVAKHSTSSIAFNAEDSLELVRDIGEEDSKAGSPHEE